MSEKRAREDYEDADGNSVSLEDLVRKEPEWAANRIRAVEKQAERDRQAAADTAALYESQEAETEAAEARVEELEKEVAELDEERMVFHDAVVAANASLPGRTTDDPLTAASTILRRARDLADALREARKEAKKWRDVAVEYGNAKLPDDADWDELPWEAALADTPRPEGITILTSRQSNFDSHSLSFSSNREESPLRFDQTSPPAPKGKVT